MIEEGTGSLMAGFSSDYMDSTFLHDMFEKATE